MKKADNDTRRLQSGKFNTHQPGEWKDHSRCSPVSGYSEPWHREYRQGNTGNARVAVEDMEFEVSDHEFWRWYSVDWERQTERIYRQFVKPGGLVLDVGAWIGPTVIYALAEGGEVNLGEGLSNLASCLPVLHLSIHVPFFPPDSRIDEFIHAVSAYKVFDDRGRYLHHGEFVDRVTSTERFPAWGGRKGNFFEVLMLSENT